MFTAVNGCRFAFLSAEILTFFGGRGRGCSVSLTSPWKKQNAQDMGPCWGMGTCPIAAWGVPSGTGSRCRSNAGIAQPSWEGSTQALCLKQGQHPRATVGFHAGHPHGTVIGMLPRPFPDVYSHHSPVTGEWEPAGSSFPLHWQSGKR